MNLAGTISHPRAIAGLLPSDLPFWGVLAAIAAIVPPWGYLISVDVKGLPQVLAIAAAMLSFRAGYVAARPNAHIVHTLLETAAGVIAYTAVLAPVSYLCARNTIPLFDDALQAADEALGYDWQAWAGFEQRMPGIGVVLRFAYASLLPQTVLLLAILPIVGDGRRGHSLIRASLVAVIIACAGSYAFPAAGPDAVHADWYSDWAALRTAKPFTMVLQHAQGIIAFPSFHAALAIIFFYFVRGLGVVTWAFGALEVLMLISTPTHGHHFLCDVIAGIAVAVVAIVVTNRLDRSIPVSQPAHSDGIGRAT